MKNNNLELPELQIRRVSPDELPENMVFMLNVVYKTQLPDFIIITDDKHGIVYVNKAVTDEEIENIIKVIEWPTHAIFDEENEAGKFCDYAYEKYGWTFNHVLSNAHTYRYKIRMKQRAKEHAEMLIPFLWKYFDELPCTCYPELVDEIAGESKSMLVNLGYLIGKGIVSVDRDTLRIAEKGDTENSGLATEIIAELENTLQNDLKAFEDIRQETDNESIIKLCKHREKSIRTIFEEK